MPRATNNGGPREEGVRASATRLPIGSGVCAFDTDECTVTIALDSEADVWALLGALPHRNRVKVCD